MPFPGVRRPPAPAPRPRSAGILYLHKTARVLAVDSIHVYNIRKIQQAIQNAMAILMNGRTSFVIAHRLSTIRDANVILYMENGDIKEVGNHDALMKQNGKYAALYSSQFA